MDVCLFTLQIYINFSETNQYGSSKFAAECVTHAEHEIVGQVEIAQLIADLQKTAAPDIGFQSECLIEDACVGTVSDDVTADTGIDAEYGQRQFGAQRESG